MNSTVPAPSSPPIPFNVDRLVRTRLTAWVQPTAVNVVTNPNGLTEALPGQGGVVANVTVGDRAGGWQSDHLEAGVSLWSSDPAANQALQFLSCVGNRVVMQGGPASGAAGMVYGKHGAVLAAFPPADLARIAPGEPATVEAWGVGLQIDQTPEIRFHSCSPELAQRLFTGRDDQQRLIVPISAALPPTAAAAGIGMPAGAFNIDIQIDLTPLSEIASGLRFGDVVALLDHDHRFARRFRSGWVSVGVIAHGRSAAGGHGLGLATILTAPSHLLHLETVPGTRVDRLMESK
jgi:hypothetical protein